MPDWIESFSYKDRPRKFGSPRKNGRLHAGCDLYAPLGSPVLAIADGRVVASREFYLETFQVTIDHGSLGVVRYGELGDDGLPSQGALIRAGEKIGSIGKLGRGLHPMLHLELFSNSVGGALTNFDNLPYLRRGDLQN